MKRSLLLGAALAALSAPAVQAKDVTIALGWLLNGQYVALMTAEAKGYFDEEDIDLTIVEGGPGKNPIAMVGAGQADLGIAAATGVFMARLAPQPVTIKAVGALGQVFPYGYLTLTEAGAPAVTPADMKGKRIAIQSDGEFYLEGLLANNDMTLEDVTVSTALAGAEPLLLGQVDFFSGMVTNQAYQIETQIAEAAEGDALYGKEMQAVLFSDHALRSFGDVVYATDATIEADPEMVEGFLRALSRGLADVLADPEEAVQTALAFPGQIEDEAKLTWRMGVQNPLAVSPETEENGLLWMDPAIWEANMAFYQAAGRIEGTVPADQVMTNAFLESAE